MLKDFSLYRNFDQDMLTVWDAPACKVRCYAFSERDKLIEEMVPVFCEYYSLVANENEKVRLVYIITACPGDPADLLMASVDKDRSLEYTTKTVSIRRTFCLN